MMQGDSGPNVRAVQLALNAHGAQLLTDGRYGPQTHSAAVAHYGSLGIALTSDRLPDEIWRSTVTSLGLTLLTASFLDQ